MEKKIVYIAGAITGTTDAEKRFSDAERVIWAKGYEVINPMKIQCADLLPDIMDVCRAYVRQSDMLFLIPGQGKSAWSWSKGACEELREFVTTHAGGTGQVFTSLEEVPEVPC